MIETKITWNQSFEELQKLYPKKNIPLRVSFICEDCKREVEKSYASVWNFGFTCRACSQKRTFTKKYGVSNPNMLSDTLNRRKQTCIEKYGTSSASQAETVKEKAKQTKLERYGDPYYANLEKCKQTCLERYGVENANSLESVKQKKKQTNLSHFGVEYPQQSKEVREKSKQTCLERYGVEYAAQSQEVKDKIVQTCLEKYGVEHASSARQTVEHRVANYREKFGVDNNSQIHYSDRVRAIMQSDESFAAYVETLEQPTVQSISKDLELAYTTVLKRLRSCGREDVVGTNTSQPENDIADWLSTILPGGYHLQRQNKNIIAPYELDIFIPELKLAIEYNGDFWHSSYYKATNYHQMKSLACQEKGIHLIHIFSYEWLSDSQSKIKDYLSDLVSGRVIKIFARKCQVVKLSTPEERDFFNQNHLQGYVASQVCYGLKFEGNTMVAMSFGKPRFNKSYQYELLRFASKAGVKVVAGASRLFTHFIQDYNPQSVISYCNFSRMKGDLYERLGFQFESLSAPNYVWWKSDQVKTRYQCQKHKLVEAGLGSSDMTEEEIMESLGYLKIYDSGQKVFTWRAD